MFLQYFLSNQILLQKLDDTDFLLKLQLSSQMVIFTVAICLMPTLAHWLTKKQTQQSNILARSLVEIILLMTLILGFIVWVFGFSVLKEEWIIYSTVLIVILEVGASLIEYLKNKLCKDLKKRFINQGDKVENFFKKETIIYAPVPFSLITGTIFIWLIDDTPESIILLSLKLFLIAFTLFIFCFLCIEFYQIGNSLLGIIKEDDKGKFLLGIPKIPDNQYHIELAQIFTEIRKIYWYDATHNTILIIGLVIILGWIPKTNFTLIEDLIKFRMVLLVVVLCFDLLSYPCGQTAFHDMISEWYKEKGYTEKQRKPILKTIRKNLPTFPFIDSSQGEQIENNKTSVINVQIDRDNFGPISGDVGGNQNNYTQQKNKTK